MTVHKYFGLTLFLAVTIVLMFLIRLRLRVLRELATLYYES